MKFKIAFYVLISSLVFLASYNLSLKVNISYLKDYLDTLLNVSGMVFTIMGIWIAFLYPNALMKLVNPTKIEHVDFKDTLKDTRRLEAIVASVLKSALVVSTIMLLNLCKLMLSETDLYRSNSSTINVSAFTLVVTLTLLQIEAIANVIYSNIAFINELHSRRQDREADRDL
ncbi:hypothetical protein [Pseudomonas libanensis]|uniref:Uncharacterized protein n=1 Tax=Pseudomonas libanensis TaxID=75588 RepID=A0ABR5M7F4_9PSED|nr:hypothetical protein [Pseudomonas libanensis]KPG74836.1 hypothetical protein AEQ48_12350 [Pseudomonas libanensis]